MPRSLVIDYAAQIGAGPLLVQGPGGNISCKDGNELWVKASGAWLANAKKEEIFLPLDLAKACRLAKDGQDDFSSAVTGDTKLRPSIETALHALVPRAVVVHVHAVDVLAYAVRHNARHVLAPKLAGLKWVWINYAKPGADLALAVSKGMIGGCAPDVFILGNHGLVVSGPTVDKVDRVLRDVLIRLRLYPRTIKKPHNVDFAELEKLWKPHGYHLPADASLHDLATDPLCLRFAKERWALYPDHVVFLGAHAPVAEASEAPDAFLSRSGDRPPFVIISGKGIVQETRITPVQQAMIGCYAEVVRRLETVEGIATLSDTQVAELLDWDKERVRREIAP